jgi:hypothetical protein
MRYALLICNDENAVLSPEGRQERSAAFTAFQDEMQARGVLLGGERLGPDRPGNPRPPGRRVNAPADYAPSAGTFEAWATWQRRLGARLKDRGNPAFVAAALGPAWPARRLTDIR